MRESQPGGVTPVSAATYPLRAALFIVGHPSVWPYCIAPLCINVLVIVLVWHWGGQWSQHWLAGHLQQHAWYWQILRYAMVAVFWMVRLVATLVAFVVVGNIASVPFNDLLSERVDRIVTNWRSERRVSLGTRIRELLLVALQELKRMSIYVTLMGTLFVLSFSGVLAPFTTAMQILLSAGFFALDYFSYALERRGVLLFNDKLAFTREHLLASLSFGGTMTLIGLIPVLSFLFIPLGVVGGTLLFADITRQPSGLAIEMPPKR